MQSGLTRRGATLFILSVLFLLAGASGAQAAEYTVTSTGDQPDAAVGSGGCVTAVGTCTLRAAIEESNSVVSPYAENTITFEYGTFDGRPSGTIELGSSLPAITRKVKLDGSVSPYQCETAYYDVLGPCTGIEGPAGGTAFRVSAQGVDLTGFAISGAKTAVEVAGGPGLFLWDNWFGLKLDGNAGPVETGVFVDQDSNGVRIGGIGSLSRNIFADDTGAGVNVDGADSTEVLGDGFGVMPDGATPAPNGSNIVVGDATTGENRTARFNWIGYRLEKEAFASPICDGGCNVIAASERSGIDLDGSGAGEEPATGSTRIYGNYIGLDAFGEPLPNTETGIHVGSAIGTTIGGPAPEDRNLIDGGADGIQAGPDGGVLDVEGNWIGLNAAGTGALDPPTVGGIAVEGGSDVDILGNRVSMSAGTAIETAAYESLVRGNVIGEGVTGARLPGGATGLLLPASCRGCAQVADNTIADASGSGVWVATQRIHLFGNRIERSGGAGIYVEQPGLYGAVWGTLVGGDAAAEENVISESGGPAIEIVSLPGYSNDSLANVVARNRGSANGGPFISLVGGIEEGIQPPPISAATEAGSNGKGAEPGAVIRVFRKGTVSPGEIEGFLAETHADEDGEWAVTYPEPIPAGTMIAATQSREQGGLVPDGEGTSELSFATTIAPPALGNRTGEQNGAAAPVSTPPRPQAERPASGPPRAMIANGPAIRSRVAVARFRLSSDQSTARFRCQLDRGPVTRCISPKTYRGLKPGKHVFRAWAVSPAGATSPTPVRWVFVVERRRPAKHRQAG